MILSAASGVYAQEIEDNSVQVAYSTELEEVVSVFDVDQFIAQAKAVKEELIRQITTPKQEDNSETHKTCQNFLRSFFGESYEKYKEKVVISTIDFGARY